MCLVERNYSDEPDRPEKPNGPDRLGLPKRIGADRNGNIALSEGYEGGKERAVIAMLAPRLESHINCEEP